ncbi:flagellar brake protein [Jeotgalibacillus marinus]|uniref:Flagellar brake domain-containing protein n=1 Tax=Jeotgalibacillus marinus TaxID=86667 RepID=A0ABV3Q091_9BACL
MLKVGMKLTLEPMYTNTDDKYRSRVVEIHGSKIHIDYPINIATDKTVFLREGMQLKASFTQSERAAFVFETEVQDRVKGKIPMVSLHYPGDEEFRRIQRRQYVRIDMAIDVAIRGDGRWYHTVTHDLSAGGLAFILHKGVEFRKEEELEIFLVLPMKMGENQYIKTTSRFVRIKSHNNIQIGTIKFLDLTSLERQLLIRFIFECQLQLRQKGLTTQ